MWGLGSEPRSSTIASVLNHLAIPPAPQISSWCKDISQVKTSVPAHCDFLLTNSTYNGLIPKKVTVWGPGTKIEYINLQKGKHKPSLNSKKDVHVLFRKIRPVSYDHGPQRKKESVLLPTCEHVCSDTQNLVPEVPGARPGLDFSGNLLLLDFSS